MVSKGSIAARGYFSSELLLYLASLGEEPGQRLPSIRELSEQLGVSTGKLREQLEVARELGLVEVRPKTGIRTRAFSFYDTLRTGLRFALAIDPDCFEQFGLLRTHIEASFWKSAVACLQEQDKQELKQLVARAWDKLNGNPVQIPHDEHRALHLAIFKRFNNPFVKGMLEAYWDAYETVGMDLYTDYAYLREVWSYHDRMVQAILIDDPQAGYEALVEHTGLIHHRPEVGAYQPQSTLPA